MTGHELLAALQAHPERLDMEVRLLIPDNARDAGSGHPLYAVDYDRFEPDAPEVLVLSALDCDSTEPQTPFPASFQPTERV